MVSEKYEFTLKVLAPAVPQGLRIIEKGGWTGLGLFFPRKIYPTVKDRQELTKPGVYVLWSTTESGHVGKVYIGEGDELLPRLQSHDKTKVFWSYAVAFTSKDMSLNKAHIKYLEARLYELAKDAGRCELETQMLPNPSVGRCGCF